MDGCAFMTSLMLLQPLTTKETLFATDVRLMDYWRGRCVLLHDCFLHFRRRNCGRICDDCVTAGGVHWTFLCIQNCAIIRIVLYCSKYDKKPYLIIGILSMLRNLHSTVLGPGFSCPSTSVYVPTQSDH